jgi:hypothetical protein
LFLDERPGETRAGMTTPKTRTHAKTAETLGGEQALAEALCVNVYARAQAVEALALRRTPSGGTVSDDFKGHE